MMKITLDNYEAYFLDYMEGRLNSGQLGELSLFLALNPELKPQLENIEDLTLTPDIHTFNNKLLLKKFEFQTTPITDYNFNDFCIAYCEGILNDKKASELMAFCQGKPNRELDLKKFKAAYLKPQLRIKYQGKDRLYRTSPAKRLVTMPLLRLASLAAGIALIITVSVYLIPKKEVYSPNPSVVHPKRSEASNNYSIQASSQITRQTKEKQTNKMNNHIQSFSSYQKLNSEAENIINPAPKEQEKFALLKPSELKLIENPEKSALKKYAPEGETQKEVQFTNKTLMASAGDMLEKITNDVINLNEIKDNKGKISFFKIFKTGIKGINYLTDSNMSLTEKTDSTGNITALSFESQIIKFHQKRNY